MVSVVFESDGILHIVSAAWEATVNRLVFYGVTAPLVESTPTTWQVRRSPVTHLWAVATTATERLEAGASVIRHHAAGSDGTVFAVPGTPYQCTVSPIGSESESPCAVAREYATLMTQIAFTNASGPVRVAGIVPQLAVLWADAVGARANLVLLSTDATWRVQDDSFRSRSTNSWPTTRSSCRWTRRRPR